MTLNKYVTCAACNNQEKSETSSDIMVNCDGCSRSIHKKCTDLTASEWKVMDLKNKRSLKFFCDDCQAGLLNVPKLINMVSELKMEIEKLKTTSNTISQSTSEELKSEEVINEMTERQKRANNLMIFNMPERDEDNDRIEANRLIESASGKNFTIKKISRVGKKNKNGCRALKISLSSQSEVFQIIKNKLKLKSINGNKIYINTDLTTNQREQYTKIKEEMSERISNGETGLYIKYLNGNPKIISKN